ncbi:class I SAM-dependent methyltransferase [Georgenia thermotolerans]|uniref:Methyltransferase domain-containing protein n=1 Tax=Georgenia thermotolerans TaxID=527326 RepID=A0A7J5URG3_9MICO|nr:class I SAM-dependent methyltransferase [Georgenia thermotolerans]KAE8764939.1 methyltransferase domain-containing protein [Georgenia thermotolerans]
MRPRSAVKLALAGSLPERLRSLRDGQAAIRVATVGAALESGVLDALVEPRTTAALADTLAVTDVRLLEAFLEALEAGRLVRSGPAGHRLTRRGRAVLADDVVRAAYEGFSGYHTGLYRDLPVQLRGGPARSDIARHGDVIARLSRAFEPLVHDALAAEVERLRPARVLDVGCGDGTNLEHILRAAPEAEGTGVEVDAVAARMAQERLARADLADRGRVLAMDVRGLLADPARLGGPVDLALLANVVYYLPAAERSDFLHDVAALVRPGGTVMVVSTVAEPSAFSRHFDLLLRAQEGEMSLPTARDLAGYLAAAGLEVTGARRLTPGDPLHAVTGRRRG